MDHPLKLAVIGLGRIGAFHAQHVWELANEKGRCKLVAVVDSERTKAEHVARELPVGRSSGIAVFASVEELVGSGMSDAAFVCSPTAHHREHAEALIKAGHRVLLEKPLTGSLEEDRAFTAFLNRHHPDSLMLAFQRRFDAPLVHAKRLLEEGSIGRPFKCVSVLEDSGPLPENYQSPGLLADMSVHNIDEVLWLSGAKPIAVGGFASRVYGHRIATVEEDCDDAQLQMWFDSDLIAQIQVSRNHVSGYRTETWIFGEEGVIHVGPFQQNRLEIIVEAFGRDRPIDRQVFQLRDYGRPVPEFIDRFGLAYRAELEDFVERCLSREPFRVNQNDGLRAMEVIDAGERSMQSRESGVAVDYSDL
ncbi:MAG: Gfo/Idh/MocA family oxidoreductase [Planctomycetota bacterium]|jgi:myo-inositol 2-dehydrogenase/D-chiro-inositol 1-dehydrogenase